MCIRDRYEIPRFILQPLVENAVLHGFDNNDICATVKIDIHLEEKNLFLCVTDDGKGLSREKIDEILNIERKSEKRLNKIGIYNVNQRIKLTYGQEYACLLYTSQIRGQIAGAGQCGQAFFFNQ